MDGWMEKRINGQYILRILYIFFNFTLHIGKLSDFFLLVTEFLHLGDLNVENQSHPL